MTPSHTPGRHGSGRGFLARAWSLFHPYWHSGDWLRAWALLLAVVALSFGSVGLAVVYNTWHKDFYNALQARDGSAFGRQLLLFGAIAGGFIVVAAYRTYLKSLLAIRWRRWMSQRYFGAWLGQGRHYRMQLQGAVDNPDQRLSQDIDEFTRRGLEIGIGLLQTVTSLVSFSVILWNISGSVVLFGVRVPGYMFWAALLYASVGSVLVHLVGRRLIGLSKRQQQVEADLRFSLLRIRENGESIALQRGEPDEETRLNGRFARVWDNFHALIRKQKRLAFFTAGYTQFSFVFPLMVAAPRFFSGQLQFGQLMQVNQAFGNLQGNLSWFVAVYDDLVAWRAAIERLLELDQALAGLDVEGGIEHAGGDGSQLQTRDLQLALPAGQALLAIGTRRITRGTHVLIQGPSGIGKSTLLRTLAGLWRHGQGQVLLPPDIHVLPQRAYLPVGTLRQALLYPQPSQLPDDAHLGEVLHACRLGHLAGELDRNAHWEQRLSPGEQQRLAFARALLARPRWLLLDEATASLDTHDEARMYGLLEQRLPDCTRISIGHRPSLLHYHTRVWQLSGEDGLRDLPASC